MSDKLTNEEQFNEYWKDAVGKSPYTHAKAIAKHAWDAGQARANAQGEAVAWRAVDKNGAIVRWIDIWRSDLSDHPWMRDPSINGDSTKTADKLEPEGAPHIWQPLYAHPPMPDSLPDEHVVATLIYQLENNMSYDKSVLLNALRAHMGRKG